MQSKARKKRKKKKKKKKDKGTGVAGMLALGKREPFSPGEGKGKKKGRMGVQFSPQFWGKRLTKKPAGTYARPLRRKGGEGREGGG